MSHTASELADILEADSQIGGTLSEHDIDFLQAEANLLGIAIEHQATPPP